jgi:uncharacterized protein YndB with AHSA1/START domain
VTDGGFTITRVFDAPPERIWREWTEPERFADWYGGPDGVIPLDTVEMDVRPGGTWRATMFYGPDRREIRWKGEYREVDPPRRLVLTLSDQPDGGAAALVTVELIDLGDGRTEMRFEQRDGMTPEQHDAAKSGWGGFFDHMAGGLSGA